MERVYWINPLEKIGQWKEQHVTKHFWPTSDFSRINIDAFLHFLSQIDWCVVLKNLILYLLMGYTTMPENVTIFDNFFKRGSQKHFNT